MFGQLEIGIWILFVICFLVLEILSKQGLERNKRIVPTLKFF